MGNPGKGSNPSADIHAAARTGDVEALQSISSSNPLAINSRDKHSRTPLHLAAWAGQTEAVSYLCKHKADVGAAAMDDMGAVHFASQKGHLEIVRILLSSGVSVKAPNRKGLTPLHYAVQGSHLELIKYLVRKGASLTAKTKAGKTPVDLANSDEVRSLLVECQASSKAPEEAIASKVVADSLPTESPKDTDKDGVAIAELGEEKDGVETKKRKVEEAESEGSLPKAKKADVALKHLLAGNDNEEEEEE